MSKRMSGWELKQAVKHMGYISPKHFAEYVGYNVDSLYEIFNRDEIGLLLERYVKLKLAMQAMSNEKDFSKTEESSHFT